MDIRVQIERIHAAKIAGKPMMHCLRDVVYAAAKLAGVGNPVHQASEAAWKAAVEYGWVVTAVERATAQSFLRTYAAQWTAEARSGEPGSPVEVASPIQHEAPRESTKWSPKQYPARAAWLRARLAERDWNPYDLASQGGPDPKTTKKVLAGSAVREGVLEKITAALSEKRAKVDLASVPQE